MINTDFIKLYEKLSDINNNHLNESSVKNIDLSSCRVIISDVKDIRGELETSSCLEYNGELTRVQVRTVIIRETENGKEFLAKKFRYKTSLPGGGYDQEKDHGDILKTAKRESLEEFNFVLTDVKDTGIRTWRHREDPWVDKHIENPEDKWTGYYSYFAVGKVSGNGNNENPEEINKWKWYPIKDLEKINKDVYEYIIKLDEAIKPDKQGRPELGEISYLCNTLETLRKILKTMEIQKTYIKEVRYEVGESDNTKRIRQYSVSTSTDLTGHAKRRPNKWGFGIILNGAILSKYYDIEPYNHADHKLMDLYINKLAKIKPGVLTDGRTILMLGEYGNRIISSKDDADLKLYDTLMNFLKKNPKYLESARTKEYYISDNNSTKWRYHPFGYEKGLCDSRFTNLSVDQIEELYVWPFPFSKNAIPIKKLDKNTLTTVVDILGGYSSFEENEERIWVENELINYLQIPEEALSGIILPSFFKEEFEKNSSNNDHLSWLKQFVKSKNLKDEWHDYVDKQFYKDQLDSSTTDGTLYSTTGDERWGDWDKVDNIMSDPKNIISKVGRIKDNGIITSKENNNTIKSISATAAVKLAIKEEMTDLTFDNFDEKYKQALAKARIYYRISGFEFRAKSKADRLFVELFDYYCPEKPKPEEKEKISMLNLFLDIVSSEEKVKEFIKTLKKSYPNRLLIAAYTLWFMENSKEQISNYSLPVEISYQTFLKICERKYNLTEDDLRKIN